MVMWMGAKIVISPGQALLLLIDHYKDNERKANELKLLYLSGAINPRATEEIKTCLNDPFLSSWEIAFTPKIIDADPTRRYFETHLAHATLAYGLQDKDVKKEDLEKHIEALSNMIGSDTLRSVQHVLNGQYVNASPLMHKEYADYISKINAGTIFQTFSANDRDVIALLVKSSFLGVVNAQVNKSLPLDLYGKGIYSDEKKGKQLHPDQVTTRSQHLGIMKGHMPLPQDDIARAEAAIGYLKPSDQAIYNENAAWVQGNFERLVHPFSNSISGTMLCQLRSLARLHADHQQDPVTEASIS